MESFIWNKNFVTGLTEVDSQHRSLVDVINRFGELVMREEGASLSAQEKVFGELADYARYHFTEEEALMAASHLDIRHIEQHAQSHKSFMDEVVLLHQGVAEGNRDAAKSLLQFLTHWLAYHILGSDQFMAKQIASIKSGRTPQQAFADDAPTNDPATATLLAALNGLFQQVSERNRELVDLNRTLEARVAERTQALTDANRQLEDMAHNDILTGLPNRRYAMRHFATEWTTSVRLGSPLACMMIDADGFKAINDTYGHDAGDTVLRTLAAELRNGVRTDDVVCRLGGDEFLVICAGTSPEGALKLAETIHHKVSRLRVSAGTGEWCGSISVGVAARTPEMKSLEDLIKAADCGVYAAKRNGRNCVAAVDANGVIRMPPRLVQGGCLSSTD